MDIHIGKSALLALLTFATPAFSPSAHGWTQGSGTTPWTWHKEAVLDFDDPQSTWRMIAFDGRTAVAISHTNQVQFFEQTDGQWSWSPPLSFPEIQSQIDGVGIDGDTAVVVTRNFIGPKNIFILGRTTTGWQLQHELYATHTMEETQVDVSGDRFALENYTVTKIYSRTSGTWQLEQILPGHGEFDLDGNRILIGDAQAEPFGSGSGAAEIWEFDGSQWLRAASLTANVGHINDLFGAAVALSHDTAVVLAFREDGFETTGAVYVFVRGLGEWAFQQTIVPSPSTDLTKRLAIAGDRIFVQEHPRESGSTYIRAHARSGEGWTRGARLMPMVGADSVEIRNLKAGGDRLLTSGLLAGRGKLLAFHADEPAGTSFCFGVGCPCDNDDPQGGCALTMGVGARLAATGTASITSDDLSFRVHRLPVGTIGKLWAGTPSPTVAFGDGFLCATPTYRGFAPHIADSAGSFSEGPGIAGAMAVSSGSTFAFQAWLRFAEGTCGPGFNSSNAYQVTFKP